MKSDESFEGKRVLVIGGSRGIGAAIVRRVARGGAKVAFTYVSKPDAAEAIVRELEGEGRSAIALRADSADAAALERAVDDAASKLGGLDVLINNAGVMVFGNVADLPVEEFDRAVAVNVRGVFIAAKAASRHIVPGGKIVVIGSNTSERAMTAGGAIYGMTKAAVARLVRGLALDFSNKGIAVINVQPGPTTTDMNPADGPHAEMIIATSPMKRVADPDEIARFVAYLASPASTYVNGASLTIDGGFAA